MAERADIKKGPIFRAIDRWEAVEERALTLQSVSGIAKQGCDMAEREAEASFAPGLRDGYLTGAARQGIGLPDDAAAAALVCPAGRELLHRSRTRPALASMMQRTE
jgi:hypothetical protein